MLLIIGISHVNEKHPSVLFCHQILCILFQEMLLAIVIVMGCGLGLMFSHVCQQNLPL